MGMDDAEVPIVNAVMEEFGWERCAVIATTQGKYSELASQTKTFLENAGKTVFFHITNPVTVPAANRVGFRYSLVNYSKYYH